MNVSVPYSASKRYLSGMDWTIGALDHMSRRATGGSNSSQIVLDLGGAFDVDRFRTAMQDFSRLFPLLSGWTARDWNLAPYWATPRRVAESVGVEVEELEPTAVHAALERSVNTLFRSRREHLVFRVLRVTDGSTRVAMHFDHRLFDAQGAEGFLQLFQRWQSGEDCGARLRRIETTEPAQLSDWMHKFDAGRQVVRLVRGFKGVRPATLPRPEPLRGRRFRFEVVSFDEREAEAITGRAYREAGFLMFMPYALASVVQVLHGAFQARKAAGTDYVLSVSIDLRSPDTAAGKLFFNHVSFLIFRIPVGIASRRSEVLEAIRGQMYEQIKNDFPRCLAESSLLMRIMPLPVLSRLMLRPLQGEFASLGFSAIGKGGYPFRDFMQAEVRNLIHMPLVPVPPGLGFVVNQFGGRLNAVLSYVDGLLDAEQVGKIAAQVRQVF